MILLSEMSNQKRNKGAYLAQGWLIIIIFRLLSFVKMEIAVQSLYIIDYKIFKHYASLR